MRKLKTLAVLAVVATLVVAIPVFADGLVTVTAGSKSVTSYDVDFGTFAADFADQTGSYTTSATLWEVTDLSDDGVGWSVDIAATDFINGTESFPLTAAADTVRVNNPTAGITCAAGACTAVCAPVSTATGGPLNTLDNTTPLTVFENKTNGVDGCAEDGTWTWNPQFMLTIPGGTVAGDYVSTWTLTIVDWVP